MAALKMITTAFQLELHVVNHWELYNDWIQKAKQYQINSILHHPHGGLKVVGKVIN